MKIKCREINKALAKKYLTPNKEYEVKLKLDGILIIKDDQGDDLLVKLKNCSHINSNWEVC